MALLDEAKRLFGSEPRPEHFTDHEHCSECAEHDEMLRSAHPDSLTFGQVPPGWDAFCFVSVEGFKYYFPALVRLAVDGAGESYYIDRFLFHLELDGPGNARYQAFTTQQRNFVVRVLDFLLETHAEEIEANLDTEMLFKVRNIWSVENAV